MYRIHQIRLRLDEKTDILPQKILKRIGGRDFFLSDWRIVKESLDARDKQNICRVYSVDFTAVYKKNPKKKVKLAANPKLKLELAPDLTYKAAVYQEGEESEIRAAAPARVLTERPVIVGFGPAGMFAALILAQAGLKPLVLERGQDVDARTETVENFWKTGVLNVQSNVQFGEGGAGTFSDGKLTTGIKDVRIRKVLEEFAAAGAPAEILYKQKPHIGTDVLRIVVKNIREEIRRLGGEVRFNTLVQQLRVNDGKVSGIVCTQTDGTAVSAAGAAGQGRSVEYIPCQAVIFAIGHSARDTFRWLHACGIEMSQKPFSVGVRIEHPQDLIDMAQYGAPGRELGLPPADYKLNWRCENGRGVYTFCMCPGGRVVTASSQEGGVVTNGMSYHDRASGTANSALLCDVRTSDFGSDDVLAGVAFQEKLEHLAYLAGGGAYQPPRCTWGELRDGRAPQVESCLPDFAVAALREAMPHLGRKLRGFDDSAALMTAVETRSSSPVRFARNSEYEGALRVRGDSGNPDNCGASDAPEALAAADASDALDAGDAAGVMDVPDAANTHTLFGFYPCGEGAGYAGGIMSAAVDGIRIAETIIRKWKPTYL